MPEKQKKIIGIIGGVGPYAGIEFNKHIFDATTDARKDGDHLSTVLVSCPSMVPDRTKYLLGEESENPAAGLFQCAKMLDAAGAAYISIACNTAHSKQIFNVFSKMVAESLPKIVIVNMIESCKLYLQKNYKYINRIAYLSTIGTIKSRVYHEYFTADDGWTLLEPDTKGRKNVHDAIYSEDYGVKAFSNPVKTEVRKIFQNEIEKLVKEGAQAVILGCTEIAFGINANDFQIPILDPAKITAARLAALVQNV
ncbi:aspartate racemase [Spirochaetia bacterium]|nr:aspartate racemase [Spirochaetia bacterium]